MTLDSRRGRARISRQVPAIIMAIIAVSLSICGQTAGGKPEGILMFGQPGAPIKMEVFSDFQCPICRSYYMGTLKPLIADYAKSGKADKLFIIYHDYPLENIHQFARKAVRFSLAAHRLGMDKWSKVTDALYAQQAAWAENGNIEAILEKALDPGDMIQLKKSVVDPALDTTISQEVALAQSREITATPTTFIITDTGRQQKFTGDPTLPALKDYLDKLTK